MLAASLGTGAGAPRDGSMADLAAPANAAHTPRTQHDLAGYGSILATMKFMRWAIEQDRFPTVEAVQCRFKVCRATAYRWTLALAEAYGIDPAIRHSFEEPASIRRNGRRRGA